MKPLISHTFNAADCRRELNEYDAMLASKAYLSERKDVLPFFSSRLNLSLLVGTYIPSVGLPDLCKHEFQLQSDFTADLIVGDSRKNNFLLVEFEDGGANSVFVTKGKKMTPDWAPRVEGAFSQIVDWLWKLEDMRNTADFRVTFGMNRAKFHGLIVIGKGMSLHDREKDRLKWRVDRTLVDSNPISIVSFEELREDMDFRLTKYFGV